MNFKNEFAFLLLCTMSVASLESNSQSLNGKVIYVSPSEEVMLKFQSVITDINYANKEASTSFRHKITHNKNFSINSTVDNFSPTSLFILEGGNTHLFILEYKATLDPRTETLYDFSSKKKLKAEAEKIDAAPKDAPPKSTVDTETKVIATTTTTTASPAKDHTSTAEDINNSYSELKLKANQAFLRKEYDQAKELYTKALQFKPNDTWCVSQIQWIESQKNVRQVEDQQKISDLAFKKHLQSGDSSFDKKSYDAARVAYNDALREKPNDSYAKNQLLKIDQALKEEAYKSYMSIGGEALTNQLYDNAESAYKEALKIKPNDPEAKKGLAKITTARTAAVAKQKVDQLKLEKENQYKDTVGLADNMFDAGLYAEARTKYVKADKMKPGESRVKGRISEIDSILERRKAEVSKLKQDSINAVSYQKEMEKGNKAFEAKDYKKAKSSFEMAQKLKPLEKYPAERISTIDVLLAQMEEERKAEAQRKALQDANNKKYSFAIKQGSAAMNKGEYKVAKSFYLEAQEIKPEEKLPGSQLKIINAKLAEIRDDERYEEFIHRGDSSYIIKDYKSSLFWYDSARILRPSATFPTKQILAVNQELLVIEEIAMKKRRTEEFNSAMPYYRKADTLRGQQKYEAAYTNYSEFLSRLDTINLAEYLRSEQFYIANAKEYLSRLERYRPKPKVDSVVAPPNNDDNNKKKKKKKGKDTSFSPRLNQSLVSCTFGSATLSALSSRMKRTKVLFKLPVNNLLI